MSTPEDEQRGKDGDARLAAQFAALRAEEAATAPPVPGPVVNSEATPALFRAAPARGALPAIAASALVAVIGLGLFMQGAEEDPAQVYAGIMASQQWQSDELLVVSDSLFPALESVPELYEFDMDIDPGGYQ